ncbi:MAG: ATP/GTP-binding protein [Desulfurococcales archaeon]|nr:ATP/GTP-binding protein [Desulfurococcales archaeon]
MRFVVLVGPAGSGKSTLAGELSGHMESFDVDTSLVNFDPAAEKLVYDPDVDVRDYVTVHDFMEKGLGPNGALIAAVDSLISHVSEIRRRIEETGAEYVIVDTPGQLELFAFRAGGPVVLDAITAGDPVVLVFLVDVTFFENPASIVSGLALASSVSLRLRKPQINVASRADLLVREVLEEIIPRLGEEGFLTGLVSRDESIPGELRDLSMRISDAIYSSGYIGEVIPVSVMKPETLAGLHAKIEQVLSQA